MRVLYSQFVNNCQKECLVKETVDLQRNADIGNDIVDISEMVAKSLESITVITPNECLAGEIVDLQRNADIGNVNDIADISEIVPKSFDESITVFTPNECLAKETVDLQPNADIGNDIADISELVAKSIDESITVITPDELDLIVNGNGVTTNTNLPQNSSTNETPLENPAENTNDGIATFDKSEIFSKLEVNILNRSEHSQPIDVVVKFFDPKAAWFSNLYQHYEGELWHKTSRDPNSKRYRWYYFCDICEHRVCTFDRLRGHLNQHMGFLTYRCDMCPRRYAVYSSFWNHRKRHK